MTTIQLRRGTAAAWVVANPVLAAGEPGYETDTGRKKIGDGIAEWIDLPYDDAAEVTAREDADTALGERIDDIEADLIDVELEVDDLDTAIATETTNRIAADVAALIPLARTPDALFAGAVTRDSNGAATSAPVVWPDGTPGTYTADVLSSAFPGAVDGYHVTYGSPATRTYTQPTVTRGPSGDVTVLPAIVVT